MNTPITTTITVSERQLWLLAQDCAEKIHAAVISMHIALTGHGRTARAEDIEEIRALIRSLPSEGYCSARREFVITVRYLFKELRKENRTESKWQDHIAKVREHHPELITPECEAKLRQLAA